MNIAIRWASRPLEGVGPIMPFVAVSLENTFNQNDLQSSRVVMVLAHLRAGGEFGASRPAVLRSVGPRNGWKSCVSRQARQSCFGSKLPIFGQNP